MEKELETTFYRFYSEVRVFISSLFKSPIKAEPHKYLKDRGFGRKKLIEELIKRGIIERTEKIIDQTDSDKKKPTYTVKYKLYSKDFEKKMRRMYAKYFEKNLPEKKEKEQMNEDGEGGASSCAGVGGSFEMPMMKRPISRVIAEKKMPRKIRITEKQLRYIEEATGLGNIGAVGDYTANGLILKTSDGKKDPSYNR
jgi:hypothetical protein